MQFIGNPADHNFVARIKCRLHRSSNYLSWEKKVKINDDINRSDKSNCFKRVHYKSDCLFKNRGNLRVIFILIHTNYYSKYNIATDMEKLSLLMITKNSGELLEKSLRSVQGLVDEMIIIDSNSSDRTVEIGKKF